MGQAIREALVREMREDRSVILLGEDVAAAGGVFKVTEGLLEEFGPLRVRDMPISETAILGASVGAAMAGLRPVAEIMFAEFFGVALDQVVTQAAKMHYLSAGEFSVPLVVRASAGAGLGFGAQHSQVMEHWFFGTPGLKVVCPSTPESAYRVTRAAIRDPNPVVVLEPRALYAARADFDPDERKQAPLGRARRVRAGAAITVLALGRTVGIAERAAALVGDEFSADVLDLESVVPWDRETVLASVRATGRLLVVEEAPPSAGWGAHVIATVCAAAWAALKAAPVRMTGPEAPIPFAAHLEERWLPSVEAVAEQIRGLCLDGRVLPQWWEER
jgi:acetoin:2,6-dichlorophenolindophenol oxidoreductase subunit beta